MWIILIKDSWVWNIYGYNPKGKGKIGKRREKKERKKPNGLCWVWFCICFLHWIIVWHVFLFKTIFINSTGDSFSFKIFMFSLFSIQIHSASSELVSWWSEFILLILQLEKGYDICVCCMCFFTWKEFLDFLFICFVLPPICSVFLLPCTFPVELEPY